MKNKGVWGVMLAVGMMFFSFSGMAQTTVSAIGSDTICSGDTVSLVATGATTYAWTDTTGNNTLSASSGDTVKAYPTMTTTYMIEGTTGSTKDTTYFKVTVRADPNVKITLSAPAVCLADTLYLYGSGASTYEWSSTGTLPVTTGDTVYDNPLTPKTYYVKGTDMHGCVGRDTIGGQVKPLPRENFRTTVDGFETPNRVCANETLTLTATHGNNLSYTWAPANVLSGTTGPQVTANLTQNETIFLTIDSANGCSRTVQKLVTLNSQVPKVNVQRDEEAICLGQTSQITILGAVDVRWSPTTGLDNPNSNVVNANPTATTTYNVKGHTDGCIDDTSITVTVHPLPTLSLSSSSGGTAQCAGVADTITANSNGILFDWGFGVISTKKVKAFNTYETTVITVIAFSDKNCENSANIQIRVDTTCGTPLNVEENNYLQSVRAWVNGQDQLILEGNPTQDLNWSLVDMNGRQVGQGIWSAETTEVTYDLSELEQGIYVVRLLQGSEQFHQKIVKQ
ncbi:T9SS type A sorting domain-containing protein [bacterium SCSIO 12741]|nr:T9SS type A sorting domain-containing protein [bacterium SCSIO 12741]